MPVDKADTPTPSKFATVAKQYGAICVRRRPGHEGEVEVLLITSRETGRWVIPKGWGMRKRKSHKVAAREAWEEAGMLGKVRKKPVGYYTYVKKMRGRKNVTPTVLVHVLYVTKAVGEFPECCQRQLRWFSPEEASIMVKEPELSSLLKRTRRFARW